MTDVLVRKEGTRHTQRGEGCVRTETHKESPHGDGGRGGAMGLRAKQLQGLQATVGGKRKAQNRFSLRVCRKSRELSTP